MPKNCDQEKVFIFGRLQSKHVINEKTYSRIIYAYKFVGIKDLIIFFIQTLTLIS